MLKLKHKNGHTYWVDETRLPASPEFIPVTPNRDGIKEVHLSNVIRTKE